MGLGSPQIDGGQQVLFFDHIEPGDCPKGRADGDDIDGHQVHPGAPLGDGFHAQAQSQAGGAENDQHGLTAELGEPVQQGLCHGLKHILQGADSGKEHGYIQNHREQLPKGDILKNGGQRDEQQRGTGSHIQPVGKAGGDDDHSRHHGRQSIKDGGVPGNSDHVLFLG